MVAVRDCSGTETTAFEMAGGDCLILSRRLSCWRIAPGSFINIGMFLNFAYLFNIE